MGTDSALKTEVMVLEFLQYLLEMKLNVGMIKIYKVALSNRMYYVYGLTFEKRSRNIFMWGAESLGYKPVTIYKCSATKVVNFIFDL